MFHPCLYCSGHRHNVMISCPRRLEGHLRTSEKLDSKSPIRSSSLSGFTCLGQSNSFKVLSLLDDLLSE